MQKDLGMVTIHLYLSIIIVKYYISCPAFPLELIPTPTREGREKKK